jgi:hypothetical protein
LNHTKAESIWRNDKTGQNFLGQQYLWALLNWLADLPRVPESDYCSRELRRQVSIWLGPKNPEKTRFIRIMISKLTYDWKSLKKLQHKGEYKLLEYQTSQIDIFHHAFPKNLDALLERIGGINPLTEPEERNSIDREDKTRIEHEFLILCHYINSDAPPHNFMPLDKDDLIKVWLITSLTKTLKEQSGLNHLLARLVS